MKARILVADDDPATLDLLTYFRGSKGFEVVTADDGTRAVEVGSSGDFELAIVDIHMPMYDGVEVVDLLKRRHVLHPLKVIALTGDLSSTVRSALAGRIDAYLTKPVDLHELEAEVLRLSGATSPG